MAKARITRRLQRIGAGHFGDCEPVGEGVSEVRIAVGPGYRVYFARLDAAVYVVPLGGDKNSQPRDIKRAKAMWREMKQ